MGMFAGVLSGLGQEMQRDNINKVAFEHEAHEQLAQQLESMAKTAYPDFAPKLLNAAFQIRSTPPGKKPPKDATDLVGLFGKHIAGQVQAGTHQVLTPGQSAGGNTVGQIPPPPAGPDAQQGADGGQVSQGQQVPTGVSGVASQLPPPPPPAPVDIGVRQPGADSPGPVSAIPSPGFAAGGGISAPPPNTSAPTLGEGQYVNDQGETIQNYAPLPQDLANREIYKKRAEDEAQQDAEMRRMITVNKVNKQSDREDIETRIGALKQEKDPATDKSVWDTLSARQRAEFRAGNKAITPELKPQTIAGTASGSTAPEGQIDVNGQAVSPTAQYRIRVMPDGTREWNPVVAMTGRVRMPSSSSPTGWSYFEIDRQGNKIAEIPGAAPDPAYAPVTQNGQHMQVVDFGDHKELVPITESKTTQRTIPGIPAPPPAPGAKATRAGAGVVPPANSLATPTTPAFVAGGRVLGSKGLQPFQAMNAEGKLGALNNTIDIVKNIQTEVPMLNSLIAAGKIKLQIDPKQNIFKAIVNRNVPLSPEEAQLAADFASLSEHINTLRGPLGATGFRGADAYATLQSQGGQLLANPEITKRVLDRTLTALMTQQGVLGAALHKPLTTPPPSSSVPAPPTAASSGVPAPVAKLLDSAPPGHHTLSDGSKWLKGLDGKITKE